MYNEQHTHQVSDCSSVISEDFSQPVQCHNCILNGLPQLIPGAAATSLPFLHQSLKFLKKNIPVVVCKMFDTECIRHKHRCGDCEYEYVYRERSKKYF